MTPTSLQGCGPVLVTGSDGFIGRWLAPHLKALGAETYVIRNHNHCDLRAAGAVAELIAAVGPRVVVHLAASPDDGRILDGAFDRSTNTVMATENLVDCLVGSDCLVIHAGSYKQYGHSPLPFCEVDAARPFSHYGMSKQISEEVIAARSRRDSPSVLLRIGPVYGPGQSPRQLVPKVISALLDDRPGDPVPLSRHPWDPVYITDVLEAIVRAILEPAVYGQVVNVSSGVATSAYEVAQQLGAELGMDPSRLRPLFTARSGEGWGCVGDASKAAELLQWTATVTLREGLARTVKAITDGRAAATGGLPDRRSHRRPHRLLPATEHYEERLLPMTNYDEAVGRTIAERPIRLLDRNASWRDIPADIADELAVVLGARGTSGNVGGGYVVEDLPVEFHCHGLHQFDFSDLSIEDLPAIDAAAGAEGVRCVMTLYVPRPRLDEFVAFMRVFGRRRRAGALRNIAGVGVEGPLLGSFGGTPEHGVWPPSREQWESLASCGRDGLIYVILSPDAWVEGSHLYDGMGLGYPSRQWVVNTLWDGNVAPSLGHFHKQDPAASAAAVEEVLALAEERFPWSFSDAVLTDHLFNDMPVNCRYSWRDPAAQAVRDRDVAEIGIDDWSLDRLDEQLGPVPAALVRGAHHGRVTVCLNFDGEHVDLAVARRTVALIDAPSVIAMTDRTDRASLCGQSLHREPGTALWYQGKGVVAAGSSPIDRQMANMRAMSIAEGVLWNAAAFVPGRAVAAMERLESHVGGYSIVDPDGTRLAVERSKILVTSPQ